MRVLIVEDQKEKSEDIVNFLNSYYLKGMLVSIQQSLRSGLKDLVINNNYDLVILDMSMPNFDPSIDDPIGGTPESFAGKEFMSQMDLRGIVSPVIVVTQYSTFAKGQIALDDLDRAFKISYPSFYLGSVYYSSAEDSWKKSLLKIISEYENDL